MCIVPEGSPVSFFGALVFVNKEGDMKMTEKDAL